MTEHDDLGAPEIGRGSRSPIHVKRFRSHIRVLHDNRGQAVIEQPERPLGERIRLICSTWDPKSGRYRFDYSLVLSVILGVLAFTGIAAFLWKSWREMKAVGGRR